MARRPPTLTESWLQEQARRYLQRWSPSERRMRDVLSRRVRKCVSAGTGTWEEGRSMIDVIVAELLEAGSLDDDRFARAWADSLHRKGTSRRKIQAKLMEKGVDRDTADRAVRHVDETVEARDPELERAVAYVRRRRLGAGQPDPQRRADRRDKDLAAVARAGFSYSIAKRVIDTPDLDMLLDE